MDDEFKVDGEDEEEDEEMDEEMKAKLVKALEEDEENADEDDEDEDDEDEDDSEFDQDEEVEETSVMCALTPGKVGHSSSSPCPKNSTLRLNRLSKPT